MFRVVFKIQEVQIKVRQAVEARILIRKKQWHFFVPEIVQLVNGHATFSEFNQFYLSQKSPQFSLEIVLCLGQVKKCAGKCQIDLSKLKKDQLNRIKIPLDKSPDSTSNIVIDLKYLDSEKKIDKEVINDSDIEIQYKEGLIHNFQQINKSLTNLNSQLNIQIQRIKKQNQKLIKDKDQIINDSKKKEIEYQKKIKELKLQLSNSTNILEKEKKKVAELINLINESLQIQLLQKMESIIHDQKKNQ